MAGSTHYAAAGPVFRFNIDGEKQHGMSPTLRVDADMFDVYMELNLSAAEHLFEVKRMMIYNKSPMSMIESFPRIDYETVFELQKG